MIVLKRHTTSHGIMCDAAEVADLEAKCAELEAKCAELLEVLRLALRSHGVIKCSNPAKDAWEYNKVHEKAVAAINKAMGLE